MKRMPVLFTLVAINFHLVTANAASISYCLALRGNGQSEPSHWGALANLVEKAGLPKAQAGGSSATISMFLLDSISANPWIKQAGALTQGRRAAFFLKSLAGISTYLVQQKKVHAGLVLTESLMTAQGKLSSTLETIALSENPELLKSQIESLLQLIQDLKELGIGDTPRYAFLIADLESYLSAGDMAPTDWARVQFYAQDLYDSVRTMGNFDAADPNLFFRDGIIDFEKFSTQVGKIGTFLAGVGWNLETKSAFQKLVRNCQSKSVGKSWQEIVNQNPSCQNELDAVLDAYFGQNLNWDAINVVNQRLGTNIPTFPVVSVLVGEAYKQAHAAYNRYHNDLDRSAATSFKIQNIGQVRFGYWGQTKDLAVIRSGLRRSFPADEKSQRFLPLGSASWQSILSISPAEPGLASLRPMHLPDGSNAYAAGGWSDLHPVLMLREVPSCQSVIYVTRKGGESLFAQGVAKRLLNFDRGWNLLEDSTQALSDQNNVINAEGDTKDLTSLWSRLYNVANPKSSYMTAVANADAVLCTDWDAYTVQTQFNELINQSYGSSFVVNPRSKGVRIALTKAGARIMPTDHLSDTDPKTGAPVWVGCRP